MNSFYFIELGRFMSLYSVWALKLSLSGIANGSKQLVLFGRVWQKVGAIASQPFV